MRRRNTSFIRRWLTTTLRQALWAPGLVLMFWAIAAKGFDAYIRHPNLDIPTHLFGGLASAYFFDVGIANLRESLGQIHVVFRLALSFSLVAVIAIWWELAEFLSDYFLGSHLNLGVADTLGDLFFGLAGAACFVVVRSMQGVLGKSASRHGRGRHSRNAGID